jgi:tRNA(Arg) A34 adenosine deaminase TadA
MERKAIVEHEDFIRKAIELAISAGKKGNDSFGALLVHNGKVIATAENTSATGEGFGHAEYNLVCQCVHQFSERVMQESILYTSTTPCPRCTFAILAAGIRRIAICVSYERFNELIPGGTDRMPVHEIIRRLELKDVEILGPFLEDEGMLAFEYWGGEYHALEDLLEEAKK